MVEKKRGESIVHVHKELVPKQYKERKKRQTKKDPTLESVGGENVHVLLAMFITFPTCQVERSPLKARAL